MKFVEQLSKNKIKLLLVIIISILIILGISTVLFFSDNSINPAYGNRLDGIEDVKIDKDQTKKMIEKIKKEDYIKSVNYNIQGKIMNVVVIVKENTNQNDAKKIPKKILECFGEDQVSYYDFQIFIENENDKNENYPIIGYKKSSSKDFSYTKNRGDK